MSWTRGRHSEKEFLMGGSEHKKVDTAVLEQAAEHYLNLQDGSMSDDVRREWQQWLTEDETHRLAFSRLETLWGLLGDIPADQVAAAVDAAQKPATPVSAGGSVLSLVARPVPARTQPNRTLGWITGMAATVAVAFLTGYLLLSGAPDDAVSAPVQFATTATEQRAVKLADGSIVELGPDSRVAVDYTVGERRLTLISGEAVFTVAKNPRRPFVVQAGPGSVTAVGTVFNVKRLATNDVEVRVLEGTVAVCPIDEGGQRRTLPDTPATQVTFVTAGNITSYGANGMLSPIIPTDVREGLSWRVGVLTMEDWALDDVIHELNRYLEHEITIGDDAIGAYRFTGTVYPDQVQAWLDGLEEGYPIKVVQLGSSRILMMSDDTSETVRQ